jgi:hypothetical protein
LTWPRRRAPFFSCSRLRQSPSFFYLGGPASFRLAGSPVATSRPAISALFS